jgi:hypothetical protein
MADGKMTWAETHAKRIDQFAEKDEAALAMHNAKAMRDLEIIWHVVEARACELAGDARTGNLATLSAEAGEIFHNLKALHRRMDVIAANAMFLPVSRSGER